MISLDSKTEDLKRLKTVMGDNPHVCDAFFVTKFSL
jgi:hypothetical protein